MKAIPVQEAQGKLGQLIAEACRREVIALTDGGKRVTLAPGVAMDLEEDSPELEAELLKAAKGPFTPWKPEEFQEIADRALQEHRAKRQG